MESKRKLFRTVAAVTYLPVAATRGASRLPVLLVMLFLLIPNLKGWADATRGTRHSSWEGANDDLPKRQPRNVAHSPQNSASLPLSEPQPRAPPPTGGSCGSNLTVTSTGGLLSTPNYPGSYRSDLECHWLLTSARNTPIHLNILDMNIEAYSNCSYDYLDIHVGSRVEDPLWRRLCGHAHNFTVDVDSPAFLLVFISDSTFEEKGFQISYSTPDGSNSTLEKTKAQCERRDLLGSTEGSVTSPAYPESYLPDQDCLTLIRVPEGQLVYLNFQVLKLEFDDECLYDYVAVYDGPSEDFPKLGQFCANPSEVALKSTNNSMLLHFHSDSILNENGFLARYSTQGFVGESGSVGACKWRQDQLEGSIWSPEYPEKYPANTRCHIELIAPENHYVTLTFQDFHLEPDKNCSFDFVEIRDDRNASSVLLSRLCGRPEKPVDLKSSGNRMHFSFHSDGFTELKGFLAHYKFIKDLTKPAETQKKGDSSSSSLSDHSSSLPLENWFVQTSPNATVQQGRRHAISCIPRSPTARIRWFKEKSFLGGTSLPLGIKLVDQTTLEVTSMAAEHVGRYTCLIAEPDLQRTQSAVPVNTTIWLAMAFNDQDCDIILRDVPLDVSIKERIEFKLLKCSSPSANVTISWEKDGVAVQDNDRIQVLQPRGHLYMDKLLPSDQGFYTCVATGPDCKKRVSAIVTIKRLQNVEEVCGYPKQGHPAKDKPKLDSGRIVGGTVTEKGAYPWQAMFWDPKRKAFCGGVILNERWVISAAHCFERRLTKGLIDWKGVRLRLGKHDQSETEPQEFSTEIEEILPYPSYNYQTFDNDLALVKLKDAANFSDYILPVCLGDAEEMEKEVFGRENRLGTVSGWGRLSENGGIPRMLREIQIPVVKQDVCEKSSPGFTVTRNMFCAGYSQETVGDACKGDSGGPFVVSISGRWFLAGLVSWGEGCAKQGRYGFYTKVNRYHSWIRGIVEDSR